MRLDANDDRAITVARAIRQGGVGELEGLLAEDPELSRAVVFDDRNVGRSLLHIATDWPGHFPNVAQTVAVLIKAGADPNAAVQGVEETHRETPLHWAASSNDVAALDALLDGGADIEVPGAVFTGGAPMSNAVVFAQWDAARRLLERGAETTMWQAAALGLTGRVQEALGHGPDAQAITNALWHACRGGQMETVRLLAAHGGDLNWLGWDKKTPLDVAIESGDRTLIDWLEEMGAESAAELQ